METNTLLKQFKDECQVIEFKYEYPGYVGYEQYGIITELSESELNDKYKDIIEGYSPYILLDLNYKAARDEYRKNEKKHSWRATNTQDAFGYEDDEMEHFHHELIGQSVEEQFINDYEKRRLMEAIDSLPEAQKRRIYLHFFLGYSMRDISKLENTHHSTIEESIFNGIKNIKSFLNDPAK